MPWTPCLDFPVKKQLDSVLDQPYLESYFSLIKCWLMNLFQKKEVMLVKCFRCVYNNMHK